MTDSKQIAWNGIITSLGFEVRDYPIIRGSSGLDHRLLSLGVDDKNKRIVLVSSDPDPRIAAMMQIDVQTTMPDTSVLVVRPLVVDLGVIARKVISMLGGPVVKIQHIEGLYKAFEAANEDAKKQILETNIAPFIDPIRTAFKHVTLPTLSQIVSVVHQAAYFDWKGTFEELKVQNELKALSSGTISLESLAVLDNMKVDREYGLCPIPLYEFNEQDWELFLSGTSPDRICERLTELGVYHYFFPSPDHLALGFIDKGLTSAIRLQETIELAPTKGHPLGPAELLGGTVTLQNLIDDLGGRGFVVEGDLGIEITEAGTKARANVKFRPREGALSRLIRCLNININFPQS